MLTTSKHLKKNRERYFAQWAATYSLEPWLVYRAVLMEVSEAGQSTWFPTINAKIVDERTQQLRREAVVFFSAVRIPTMTGSW